MAKSSSKAKAATTTRICGYDEDRITIRGKDLVTELMGKVSFSEMILRQLTGESPRASKPRSWMRCS